MRVVVGLSGGVDSSAAAHLLIEQGHDVIGLFMRNWNDESVTINNECPWIDDANDAMLVANHLGIPFQVMDLSAEYKERIVDYMFAEYAAGRTPNPDVLCNREVKFDLFLEAALKLGAEAVATGHYCRKTTTDDGIHHLLAGVDGNKDQSYFLCQLNQTQLSRALFPVGELRKPQVRSLAADLNLPNAAKKDSQGLCFIGKVRLPDFLQQQLAIQPGDIVEIAASHPVFSRPEDCGITERAAPFPLRPDMGKVVGGHDGAHFFTVGQRKGLNVGGKPEPLFVLGTCITTNTVFVGQGEHHPGLYRTALPLETPHWLVPHEAMTLPDERTYGLRIRYRQPLQAGRLVRSEDGRHWLDFDTPQRGVAAGQFAAWHGGEHGDEVIGSAVIAR
ncbi:MAG: tRNA 2-thiouridine(34) synthase MnmA [Bacteroidetes bacterium]|nr:tRNA 2-thiouridine(34) synthase MnmA [Bacteroidota bacterium]MDA0904381.1 tRNA 2-thiouridine(34) synthase MnmA [Bacteroidota bacterium]MDA1243046.1 tRNA 2-thiouridine(34) synthase MnmA [Bacteroidota bacterium]